MKKTFIALACMSLSACYYTVPASDYYYDDGYYEPGYYSQTTYVAPSTSYVYVNDSRPDIVYVNDAPHHHVSHAPHSYYYPKHHPDKKPPHDNKAHKAQPPKKDHAPSSIIPKSRRPSPGRNEKVVELPKDSHSHGSHNGNSGTPHDQHGSHNGNSGAPHDQHGSHHKK
jgi:hypothetical protein